MKKKKPPTIYTYEQENAHTVLVLGSRHICTYRSAKKWHASIKKRWGYETEKHAASYDDATRWLAGEE